MSFEVITGMCFGIELLEDEEDKLFVVHLGILRMIMYID